MIKWFMYLIKCEDGSFYVGSTSNTDRRFAEHSHKKGGRYTKLHKPIKIVYKEEFFTKIEVLNRERQIKGWRRGKKEHLIKYGNRKKPE